MRSDKNILVAFLLNFFFAVVEFIGGALTNSVAIVSDAIHDMGDALSIGVAYFLEKISKRKPNDIYTYGYIRYSVLGSLFTTVLLILGSIFVIYNAILRINNPVDINYNGMIILAVIGVIVNFIAAYFTRDGDSLNQKAVNLHMLEDVLGWIVVLIGAIVMYFSDIKIIDPIMSILVAIFILKHALSNLKEVGDLFLEKTPHGISIEKIKDELVKVKEIEDVHHIHIWSIDGINNYATMHVVTDGDMHKIKDKVREILHEMNIKHVTIEIETCSEHCHEDKCEIEFDGSHKHHHHH